MNHRNLSYIPEAKKMCAKVHRKVRIEISGLSIAPMAKIIRKYVSQRNFHFQLKRLYLGMLQEDKV
jgi:hypothetical protein